MAIAKLREFLEQFPEKERFMQKVSLRNRIFINRLSGTCIIEPEDAIELGFFIVSKVVCSTFYFIIYLKINLTLKC